MSSFREAQGTERKWGANVPSGGFWSIERAVALLTPLFSGASGLIVTYIAKIVPGVHLAGGEVTALFITGATAATAAALKWLHGRQKFVNFTTDADHVVKQVVAAVQNIGGAPLVDVERVLAAHEANIVQAIGNAVHAPPSAEEIAQKLVQELWPHSTAGQAGVGAPGQS